MNIVPHIASRESTGGMSVLGPMGIVPICKCPCPHINFIICVRLLLTIALYEGSVLYNVYNLYSYCICVRRPALIIHLYKLTYFYFFQNTKTITLSLGKRIELNLLNPSQSLFSVSHILARYPTTPSPRAIEVLTATCFCSRQKVMPTMSQNLDTHNHL